MTRAGTSHHLARVSTVDPTTVALVAIVDGIALVTATAHDSGAFTLAIPALLANAPGKARRAWWDRVVTNLTGRCPRCDAVAGSTAHGLTVTHHLDCLAGDSPWLAAWTHTPNEGTPS